MILKISQDVYLFIRWCPARPASWLLDNGRLNLVLLGAELLASGLQAQVPLGHDDDGDGKLVDGAGAGVNNDPVDHVTDHQVEASCPGSQFVHGGQQFALETRSISGDVDLPQFQFKTANFQPQGDHTGGVHVAADEKKENWKKSNFLRKQLAVCTFSCNRFLILKIWTTT